MGVSPNRYSCSNCTLVRFLALRTTEVSAAKTIFHVSGRQAGYWTVSPASSAWWHGAHSRGSTPFNPDRARCGCVGHCLGIDHRRRGFSDWVSNSFRQSGDRALRIGDGILLVSGDALDPIGRATHDAGHCHNGSCSSSAGAGRIFYGRLPVRTPRNRDSSASVGRMRNASLRIYLRACVYGESTKGGTFHLPASGREKTFHIVMHSPGEICDLLRVRRTRLCRRNQ